MSFDTDRFASRWLSGSTCHHHKRSIFWRSGDDRFVLMKHHGHTEYLGRFSGSERCRTYYALYDLADKAPDCLGCPFLWKVEGRWKKSYFDEIKSIIAEVRR